MKQTHFKTLQTIANLDLCNEKSHAARIANLRNLSRAGMSDQLKYLVASNYIKNVAGEYLINARAIAEPYFSRNDFSYAPIFSREDVVVAIIKSKKWEEVLFRMSEEILIHFIEGRNKDES